MHMHCKNAMTQTIMSQYKPNVSASTCLGQVAWHANEFAAEVETFVLLTSVVTRPSSVPRDDKTDKSEAVVLCLRR